MIHHPFSILEHTAAARIVDSRGTGTLFTQIAMHDPFSGLTSCVPTDQSAPGPKPGVGNWAIEQLTMEEPAGQKT